MATADLVVDNPFLVLGVAPTAPRAELEREAQKLLGMLELGFAEVATYATPLGPRPRTPEKVRAAIATLRDPARRLAAELWARAAPPPRADRGAPDPAEPDGWPDAMAELGWRAP